MLYLKEIISDESAQGLMEYSLILSIVALVAVGAVIIFGESLNKLYEIIIEDVINAL